MSGTIVSGGVPVSKATVSLNSLANFTTQSDTIGRFSIPNVPDGNYSLGVQKTNADGSFLARTSNISVANDSVLLALILPKGVKLDTLENINATSVSISWNPTDANDFREYKLYRNLTSGLDQTTGTLVHVSTAINDTSFVDNTVNPFTTYYYRVYIMNDFGNLGGSNISSITTLVMNIISNGSFETIDAGTQFPSGWSFLGSQGKFQTELQIAQDSSKSIKLQLVLSDWGVNSWVLYQQISPKGVEQGATYRVSFWCKSDSLEEYESMSAFFTTSLGDGNATLASLDPFIEGPKAPKDWTRFSFTFTVPSAIPPNYYLTFDVIRAGTMGYSFHLPMNVWLDNVQMEKIQ